MAENLKTRILLRNDTLARWVSANPVLAKGEFAVVYDPTVQGERRIRAKIGDGVSQFTALPFLADYDTQIADLRSQIDAIEKLPEHEGQKDLFLHLNNETGNLEWSYVDRSDVAFSEITGDPYSNSALAATLNTKVDKEITSTSGKALIFNEVDGGGAKFENADGTESFVGVNDGGENGLVAQIYADKLVDGSWVGSRINVYHNGIYYVSKANQLAGFVKNDPQMEIATKKDIQDLGQALHFVGIATKLEGQTELESVEAAFPAASQKAGAVAICGSKEFICYGESPAWYEFGDVSAYATRAELEAEASSRAAADLELDGKISAEAAARKAADDELKEAKLNVLPKVDDPKDPGFGWEYHIPYDANFTANSDTIDLELKTITLDNKLTKMRFTKNIPSATEEAAGLMTAADKAALNAVDSKIAARELEILSVAEYGFNTNLRVNQEVDGSALIDKVIEATNVNKKQVVIKMGDYELNVVSLVLPDEGGVKGFAAATMALESDAPAFEKGVFLYNALTNKTNTYYDKDFNSVQISAIVAELRAALATKQDTLSSGIGTKIQDNKVNLDLSDIILDCGSAADWAD